MTEKIYWRFLACNLLAVALFTVITLVAPAWNGFQNRYLMPNSHLVARQQLQRLWWQLGQAQVLTQLDQTLVPTSSDSIYTWLLEGDYVVRRSGRTLDAELVVSRLHVEIAPNFGLTIHTAYLGGALLERWADFQCGAVESFVAKLGAVKWCSSTLIAGSGDKSDRFLIPIVRPLGTQDQLPDPDSGSYQLDMAAYYLHNPLAEIYYSRHVSQNITSAEAPAWRFLMMLWKQRGDAAVVGVLSSRNPEARFWAWIFIKEQGLKLSRLESHLAAAVIDSPTKLNVDFGGVRAPNAMTAVKLLEHLLSIMGPGQLGL